MVRFEDKMQVEKVRNDYSKTTTKEELKGLITHIPEEEWTEGTIPINYLDTVQKIISTRDCIKDSSGNEEDLKDKNNVAHTGKSKN